MKLFALIVVAASIFIASFGSCKSSDQPKAFCDTACLTDTLRFMGTHELKPYVYLTVRNCKPDTIIWSYSGMGTNRMTGFENMLGTTIHMNKDFVRGYIRDTAYAWLLFNDCITGRGFQLKLPYSKEGSFSLKSSGINNFDKKFSVQENLVVNTDRGNIYVEDMQTGKKGMMTFGEKIDIDYDDIHQHIDSVNVTDSSIWVKVKVASDWKVMERKIKLE